MACTRQEYDSRLNQLKQNIDVVNQQLAILNMQEKVSRFFIELNELPSKEMQLVNSRFMSTLLSSPGFFKCEEAGEISVRVRRANSLYNCELPEGCVARFIEKELEELCKEAQWSEETCELKLKSYRVSPVWSFQEQTLQIVSQPVHSIEVQHVTGQANTNVSSVNNNENVPAVQPQIQ